MTPIHDEIARRFRISLPEGSEATLEYELSGNQVIMTHTFVPETARGQGLAEILARTALSWAAARHLKVVPRCSYIDLFLSRHPDLASRA